MASPAKIPNNNNNKCFSLFSEIRMAHKLRNKIADQLKRRADQMEVKFSKFLTTRKKLQLIIIIQIKIFLLIQIKLYLILIKLLKSDKTRTDNSRIKLMTLTSKALGHLMKYNTLIIFENNKRRILTVIPKYKIIKIFSRLPEVLCLLLR